MKTMSITAIVMPEIVPTEQFPHQKTSNNLSKFQTKICTITLLTWRSPYWLVN
jgi:hypothetical protein